MKYCTAFIAFLALNPLFAYKVMDVKVNCPKEFKCDYDSEVDKSSKDQSLKPDKAEDYTHTLVYLFDQFGYEGIELTVGATHLYSIYNNSGGSIPYIVKIKLCDSQNHCFGIEKTVRLDYGESYKETINSSLTLQKDYVGTEKLYAETEIATYPVSQYSATANLVLAPFPYDQ